VTWLLVLAVAAVVWIGLVIGMAAYLMKQPIPDWHVESDLSALRCAAQPSRPAAGPLVLGESAAASRTQSGPRRAPVGAEAGRATQLQDAEII
jgi:hypothetical protein